MARNVTAEVQGFKELKAGLKMLSKRLEVAAHDTCVALAANIKNDVYKAYTQPTSKRTSAYRRKLLFGPPVKFAKGRTVTSAHPNANGPLYKLSGAMINSITITTTAKGVTVSMPPEQAGKAINLERGWDQAQPVTEASWNYLKKMLGLSHTAPQPARIVAHVAPRPVWEPAVRKAFESVPTVFLQHLRRELSKLPGLKLR